MLTKQNSQKGGKNPSLKKAVYHLSKRYIFQIIILKHRVLLSDQPLNFTLTCTYYAHMYILNVPRFLLLVPSTNPMPMTVFYVCQCTRLTQALGSTQGPSSSWRWPPSTPARPRAGCTTRQSWAPSPYQFKGQTCAWAWISSDCHTAYRNIWFLALLQSKVMARKTQDEGWNWSFLSYRVKPAHWGTQFSKLKSKFWWG